MAYVDYTYYISEYMLGKTPAVAEKEFPYWEKQARTVVDQFTFGRVAADPALLIDAVKDCCCELAELLYQADQIALSQSVYTESGRQNKVREIIYRYLAHTGLLYAGV